MTRRADMPRAFSRCHYLSVDAGAESEIYTSEIASAFSYRFTNRPVYQRNSLMKCTKKRATFRHIHNIRIHRIRFHDDSDLPLQYFQFILCPKATDNFRQNFSRYTFSIICISFFYLSSVSYQNSHHVSVKSCVVILHATDS